jgi:hypothetical protein
MKCPACGHEFPNPTATAGAQARARKLSARWRRDIASRAARARMAKLTPEQRSQVARHARAGRPDSEQKHDAEPERQRLFGRWKEEVIEMAKREECKGGQE